MLMFNLPHRKYNKPSTNSRDPKSSKPSLNRIIRKDKTKLSRLQRKKHHCKRQDKALKKKLRKIKDKTIFVLKDKPKKTDINYLNFLCFNF